MKVVVAGERSSFLLNCAKGSIQRDESFKNWARFKEDVKQLNESFFVG